MTVESYLMSKADAARYLARSVRQIERYIADGRLPARVDGSSVLLKRSDLEAFADELPAWEPRR